MSEKNIGNDDFSKDFDEIFSLDKEEKPQVIVNQKWPKIIKHKLSVKIILLLGIVITILTVILVVNISVKKRDTPISNNKNPILIEPGIQHIKKGDSDVSLSDIFSKPTEIASNTDGLYIIQEGAKFNLSNGYQLTVNNFKKMDQIKDTIVVPPLNSNSRYQDYADFLNANFDDSGEYDDNYDYIDVSGRISNNIAKGISMYGSADGNIYYKISKVEKTDDYEKLRIYEKFIEFGDMEVDESNEISGSYKVYDIYCFNNGYGISLESDIYLDDHSYLDKVNDKGEISINTDELDKIMKKVDGRIELKKIDKTD